MTEPAKLTLAEFSYRELRAAIWNGELEPGDKVTERGMAERLSVSPTPVREAIRRLLMDGLVDRIGPRTLRVAAVSTFAHSEIAEVEVALRGLVARFAARHATSAQLDGLDALLDRADDLVVLVRHRQAEGQPVERHLETLLDVMEQFNRALGDCSHNPVLVSLVTQTRSYSPDVRRARTLERIADGGGFAPGRYAGHRALVGALRRHDDDEAERLVAEYSTAALMELSDDAQPVIELS